jgi:hypothetical protein
MKNNVPETLACRLRTYLTTQCATLTYQEAAKGLLLSPPNTIHQITQALEQLMAEDQAAGHPFIAAMVISNRRGGLPAQGFFDCAASLGRFKGDGTELEANTFHQLELNAALKHAGRMRLFVSMI